MKRRPLEKAYGQINALLACPSNHGTAVFYLAPNHFKKPADTSAMTPAKNWAAPEGLTAD